MSNRGLIIAANGKCEWNPFATYNILSLIESWLKENPQQKWHRELLLSKNNTKPCIEMVVLERL